MISLLLATALLAGQETPPGSAAVVVAEMKAACGGDAWERVQGWHETGAVEIPGRPPMSVETWHDMRTLKTAITNRVDGKVVRQVGFDGSSYWQAGPSGQAEVGADPTVLRRQRRDAYLSSFGWFFPQRFPATVMLAGVETAEGRTFDVLRITPKDAESFDLWVDRDTHRARRISAGKEYAHLSDYRDFDAVCSATKGRQGDGDPAREIVLHVLTVDTTRPAPPGVFSPPAR